MKIGQARKNYNAAVRLYNKYIRQAEEAGRRIERYHPVVKYGPARDPRKPRKPIIHHPVVKYGPVCKPQKPVKIPKRIKEKSPVMGREIQRYKLPYMLPKGRY